MTTFLIAIQYVLIAAASLIALGVVLALVVLGAYLKGWCVREDE